MKIKAESDWNKEGYNLCIPYSQNQVTRSPGVSNSVNGVIKRFIKLQNVSKKELESTTFYQCNILPNVKK